MKREEIIAEARRYLGKPWRHQGRSIMAVDCIGLICCVADAFDIPYEDVEGYSRNPDGRFVDHVMKFMTFREPQVVAPGCAVVLRDKHQPCHIGIITERNDHLYLLHASLAKRAVVEEEWNSTWTTKLRCVLDFPGVED